MINGIFEDATETSPGYFPMVLFHIDKGWKRGGEAKWYGRFYKNDRWTWKTLVVEKDGFVHWLLPPKDGSESSDR